MNKSVLNYLRAGCSCLYLVTHEEGRAEADLFDTIKQAGYRFHVWSVTEGISHVLPTGATEVIGDTEDPLAALATFPKLDEKSVLLARDFHPYLKDNPLLVRRVRDCIAIGKRSQRVLIIMGCTLNLPPEIEKEVVVVDFTLPDRGTLLTVLEGIAESGSLKLAPESIDPLLDAASGMTTMEAENAFALSVAESGDITPEIVQREKSATVKKNGLLEIVESKTGLDDIGGLKHLKRDLHEKRNLFTKAAKEYGLPTPRGLLVLGQPGTGKSLTASATATVFGLPLIRLEAGRLFGSLVGESEANWRSAFATVKACAPCILWIDEVDGLFAGGTSGGGDSGTTQRVLKAILQDMQFNGEGVFFMFTANDIDRLPDPLIDRLDVWSVDLPTAAERADIWRIHIAKRGRNPKAFKLDDLARLTDGFSGRQIEQVWLKALTIAFNDGKREPGMEDCREAIGRVTPTSKTMATQIEARRNRLASRANPASEPEAPLTVATTTTATARKLGNK